MWTANAATVSPSPDTEDGRVHFTPANLAAMFHRAIEPGSTGRALQAIFADPECFAHHEAIPASATMGDEGAANYGRLCATHEAPGIGLFVYGRSAFERLTDRKFPPRQALEASEAVARQHGVMDRAVFIRQSAVAIDAGAFHNDVVAVANGPVLLYHEDAYENEADAFDLIRRQAADLGFDPQFIRVDSADVPLADAISSYLFNSQLLTRPDGGMALILPKEAEETESTRHWVEQALSSNGPIREAHYHDLKQSMKNGGGPACLRLRVVLTDRERAAAAPGVFVDESRLDSLEDWVRSHYRDRLSADDLADPALLTETRTALDALTGLLDLGSLYDFQRP
jgi:succinylarginine dihydrolase